MKRISLLMLGGLIVLTGCLFSQKENHPVTETTYLIPLETKTNPVTLTSSQKPTVTDTPKFSVTITPEPSSTPVHLNSSLCDRKYYESSHTPTFDWSIPLVSSNHKLRDSAIMELMGGSELLPSNEMVYLSNGSVSPNGKWFAYVAYKDLKTGGQILLVVNSKGVIEKAINLTEELHPLQISVVAGWIDDESLMLIWPGKKTEYGETNPRGITPEGATTAIVKPFSGEWVKYSSTYPNIYTLFPDFTNIWETNNYSLSSYNNSLDRVLYISFEGLILWDVSRQEPKQIISGDPHSFINKPVWSFTGDKFLLDKKTHTGYNIFIITKDGIETQITHLDGYQAGGIINYSWSPDEKAVAFWLHLQSDYSTPYEYYELSIVDISTQEINSFCVFAANWRSMYPNNYPLWSPDGNYLAVAAADETDLSKTVAVIVDIVNERAYKLADDMIPLGWMVNE